ncbi:unnamed protein product [Linum tenue]|uniref:Homeobox domain-containing protein n=1 Tax=Linum tenue TaxID=586396 RepID=A0AAV0KJY5_9ROSI|nr:unnamed protein product [Linum tenue]
MEWDNTAAAADHHRQQQRHHDGCNNGDPILNFPSTNSNTTASNSINAAAAAAGNMLYVKVMTDDQLQTLRKQIAVYATICEQLVDMHKTLSAHQDLAAGGRLGSLYCDPLMGGVGGHKMSARQRWTPTPLQLQILERIFEQGNGTPTKQKIKEITSQLSQHGQISETNVYNWFQNRRARSKRKQAPAGTTTTTNNNNNNGGGGGGDVSEVETEVDSLQIDHHHNHHHQDLIMNCSNSKSEEMMYCRNTAEDHCFQTNHVDQLHYLSQGSQPSAAGSYNLYDQAADDYGLAG